MRFPGKGMSWKEFGKGLKNELSKDNVTDLAASITYYGVLALFPFLLFCVALASVVIQPSDAERMVDQLAAVAPGQVTQILGDRIRQLGQDQNVTLLGFGALGAIWAASGGVLAVMRGLNTAYDVDEGRPFWKVRLIAVVMTLICGALALVAAVVAVAFGPLGEAIGGPLGTAVTWLRLPVAGVIMMLLWALVYYVLPDVEQKFKFITPGSVVGVVLWVLASYGFSKYVANFGKYDETYGALGGFVVLLFWMWISSLVLLLGAEVNAFIEHRSPEGKREGAKSEHDTGMAPRATVAGKEPVPVGASREESPAATDDTPARLGGGRGAEGGGDRGRRGADGRGRAPARRADGPAVRPEGRPREKPRLRGVMAIAVGFMAGVLLKSREA
jgi:membrane protein